MSVEQTTSRDPGKAAAADLAGEPPYRGLARYEADDQRWFFGREDVTELIAFLAEQRSALPLMLVGVSGAGKSSLLRAGLVPRLRVAAEALAAGSGERVAVYDLSVTGVAAVTDAVREALAEAGTGAWDRSGTAGAWGEPGTGRGGAASAPAAVIVDQFEAVFTQCPDEAKRDALIQALCELARDTLVVLALRADRYGQAIGYPGLLRALQERQIVLGPMTEEQVRRAVEEPARLAGAGVGDGLAEAVLADLAAGRTGPGPARGDQTRREQALRDQAPGQTAPAELPDLEWDDSARYDGAGGGSLPASGPAHEPGALPLLAHALLATWRAADGGRLTAAAYRAAGGVREALPRSAERAYLSLSHGQRRLARRLLPRLVQLADGLPPTLVPVPLNELRGSWAGTADVRRVLAAFAGERIITLDAGTARLTHDAVLTVWPRLRDWLEEDTDALRAGRRGAGGARPAPKTRPRRAWPLRAAVAVLVVLVLAAAGLAARAFSLRSSAVAAGNAAAAAGQAANSRAVAFVADRTRATDPATAAQLAASAYAISPTAAATASLLDAAGTPLIARLEDSADAVRSVSVSPDGRLLVAAGVDGSLRLWNIASAGHPVLAAMLAAAGGGYQPDTAAFSPDGTVIATAGTRAARGTVQLWKVTRTASAPQVTVVGRPLAVPGGTVSSVAFSSDGDLLAAGSASGTVQLWNVSGPGHLSADGKPLTVPGAGTRITSVAFGDRGGVLAAGTSAGTVVLWKVEGAAAPVRYPRMPLAGPGGSVSGVAFGPDGKKLAAAGAGGRVRLWSVRAGSGAKNKDAAATADGTLGGAAGGAAAIAFSPDGTSLATAGAAGPSGGSVLVWNLAAQAVTATVPQPQPVTSVAWVSGDRVAAATAGGRISLISLPSPLLATGNSPASVAYSPDGKTVAVGGTSVQLWDAGQRTLLATYPLAAGVSVNATAFSAAAGKPVVAVALTDGTVALLDGRNLTPVVKPFPVTGGPAAAQSVAFNGDGNLLVTGAANGDIRLFNVSDPAHPRRIAAAGGAGRAVSGLAFAPDGATVAAASADGAVRLWHVGRAAGASQPLSAGPSLGSAGGYATGVAFSFDGKTLAAGGGGQTVHLWNVADPAHPAPLGSLSGPSGHVWAVAFSSSGAALAAAATDGTVWLWNLATPAHPVLTATLQGPAGHVSGVAFAPSGDQLAAASADSGVQLRGTSPAAALAAVCGNLGQPLTHSEWDSYVPGVPYRAAC